MNASGWSVAEVLSDDSNRPYQDADAGVTTVESGLRLVEVADEPRG
jgi:hypothetical protein